MDANGTLTYDVQVKVQDNPKQDGRYAIGILTRSQSVVVGGNNDWQCYGISFMRAQRYSYWLFRRQYLNQLIKSRTALNLGAAATVVGFGSKRRLRFWNYQYSQPAIVLWQRTNGTFNWVAYKLITYDAGSQNYIIEQQQSAFCELADPYGAHGGGVPVVIHEWEQRWHR